VVVDSHFHQRFGEYLSAKSIDKISELFLNLVLNNTLVMHDMFGMYLPLLEYVLIPRFMDTSTQTGDIGAFIEEIERGGRSTCGSIMTDLRSDCNIDIKFAEKAISSQWW